MSLGKAWTQEFWIGFGLLGVVLVASAVTGHLSVWLCVALIAYLLWHLYHVHRLHLWLQLDGRNLPPDAAGIWHEIFYLFYRLKKRHRRSRRRLVDIIQQFRVSTEAMPEAALVLSGEGEILWVNRSAEALVGITRRDLGNRVINLLRFPPFVAYVMGSDYAHATELPSPLDNTRVLSAQLTVYGEDQRLLMIRDITLLTQLEQVRRDFVANVSHELRTPLTVVSGYLETIASMDDPALTRYQRPFEQMQQQAQRMRNIIDDLLFLSKVESHRGMRNTELVPLPQLLGQLVAEACALSGDKKHRIRLVHADGHGLYGNEHELRSAFSNLVFNAVRYTQAAGDIELSWMVDALGGHFKVKDNGVGIAPEHIPRITERFYRIDASRSRDEGGTGLGLAIVKHVIERHHGQLEIKSEVGKGSVFCCHFPKNRLAVLSH